MNSVCVRTYSLSEHSSSWKIRVFYDAECPLCKREIALLRRIDRGRGRVDFVDLAADDFEATAYGLDQQTIEERIHGMLPDGRIIEGVDVFVHIYSALGWGWLAAIARWPGIRGILDLAYLWFARNRLRLTGRTPEVCKPRAFDRSAAQLDSGTSSKSD